MRAIRVHEQGGPGKLRLDEVPVPEPAPGEVLLRVRAAGLNPPDWYIRSGFGQVPAGMRPEIRFPFTPGSDASGVVEALGPDADGLAVGDEVFGMIRWGDLGNAGRTYAEYATAPVAHLARKPASIDHVHAAAVPMSGLTALQNLYGEVDPQEGSRVLVIGAAGGVGHFAVQLAKARGAHVVAVASGRHAAFLKELGADEVVDYTAGPYEDATGGIDHAVDCVGGPEASRVLRAVRDGGTVTPIFFGDYREDEAAARGITFPRTRVFSSGEGMAELAGLLEEGVLRAAVERTFALEDAVAAHERAERGHLQGKLVLTVG
ncbi:NADP-dependent oxidoreductase [Actinomadura parmotrematis]|uniref:NADP-dependent oxidoreductase n=1 Tax=Actinomadura parmotrematis TaxID=2864039 RepID=A0ABS7FUE5_9ACTN|nr:NADP-dependent oxidoreductase [Actinomadura parmotrematis]MBW8484024.1 NADP-dependent oxidoreductase [Actinomadura parmotrematis]